MISSISLKLGQNIYPQESYNLATSTSGGATTHIINTNDMFRVFQDYCVFSEGYRTGSSLMNFSQFKANPLFVFKMKQSANDTSNIFSLTVNLTATSTVAFNAVILGLYDQYLTLGYDSLSRIDYINKSSSAI